MIACMVLPPGLVIPRAVAKEAVTADATIVCLTTLRTALRLSTVVVTGLGEVNSQRP